MKKEIAPVIGLLTSESKISMLLSEAFVVDLTGDFIANFDLVTKPPFVVGGPPDIFIFLAVDIIL
jgi:hypothetical protein